MTSHRKILPLFLVLLASPLAAQYTANQTRFLAVQKWSGDFSIKAHTSGIAPLSPGGGPSTYTIDQVTTGTIKLDHASGIGTWDGTVTGTVTLNEKQTFAIGACTLTQTVTAQGGLDRESVGGKARTVLLAYDLGHDTWSFSFSDTGITAPLITVNSCVPQTVKADSNGRFYPKLDTLALPFPAAGFDLKGTKTVNVAGGANIAVPGIVPMDYVITWNFTPAVEELEVIVAPEGFSTWRPKGGANEKTEGTFLPVKATLQKKGGGTTTQVATQFIFELLGVSKAPGVDINYPPAGQATTDPDLKFTREHNLDLLTVADARAETPVGRLTAAQATVSCYDWGAYGRIKVTALVGDQQIVGHIDKDEAQTEVRLPKRTETSMIFDGWKADNKSTSGADNDDSEQDPEGDLSLGHRGDGLTLYEEYRGFHENGQHAELDPNKKDFFIFNRSRLYLAAIQRFQQLTGLTVHYQLTEKELDPGLVINFNHENNSLHQTDQHGVEMRVNPTRSGSAEAIARGVPDNAHTPKDYKYVEIPLLIPTRAVAAGTSALFGTLVVEHELMHTCNVDHHGDSDYTAVYALDPTGTFVTETQSNGSVQNVVVLSESGELVPLEKFTDAATVWVGKSGGQHSGLETCVMRYECASLYVRDEEPGIRYVARGEVAGGDLCQSAAGSGVNDANRSPWPRYKEAADKRGDCTHQLCINDRYTHTDR